MVGQQRSFFILGLFSQAFSIEFFNTARRHQDLEAKNIFLRIIPQELSYFLCNNGNHEIEDYLNLINQYNCGAEGSSQRERYEVLHSSEGIKLAAEFLKITESLGMSLYVDKNNLESKIPPKIIEQVETQMTSRHPDLQNNDTFNLTLKHILFYLRRYARTDFINVDAYNNWIACARVTPTGRIPNKDVKKTLESQEAIRWAIEACEIAKRLCLSPERRAEADRPLRMSASSLEQFQRISTLFEIVDKEVSDSDIREAMRKILDRGPMEWLLDQVRDRPGIRGNVVGLEQLNHAIEKWKKS